MKLISLKTGLIKPKDDLINTLFLTFKRQNVKLKDGDVLTISSKVVALTEGRRINLKHVNASKKAKSLNKLKYSKDSNDYSALAELILQESDFIFNEGNTCLTIKDGIFIPSAGIDLSNSGDGHAILWPKDLQKSANQLWQKICRYFNLKKFGIIITDSHCQPLRSGISGIALSFKGFEGIEDCRNQEDLFKRKLKITRKAVADNLACAAAVLMGESNEGIPAVLIRGAPVKFTNRKIFQKEAFFPPDDDLFAGIYSRKFKKKVGEYWKVINNK